MAGRCCGRRSAGGIGRGAATKLAGTGAARPLRILAVRARPGGEVGGGGSSGYRIGAFVVCADAMPVGRTRDISFDRASPRCIQCVGNSLGGGWNALLQNVANTTGFCLNGLMFAAVALFVALLYRAVRMTDEQKHAWDSRNALALQVLAVWIVPMVVFGSVVGFTKQPGYVLSYLPAVFLLTAAVVDSLKNTAYKWSVIIVICMTNVVAFVAWPALWNQLFFNMARTGHEIVAHDAQISRIDMAIRRSYPPDEVAIFHAEEFYLYGIRIFQLQLPEYEQYQMATDSTVLAPSGKRMWRVRDGRLDFVEKPDVEGKKGILLLVPPAEKVGVFAPYLSTKSMKAAAKVGSELWFIPTPEVEFLR